MELKNELEKLRSYFKSVNEEDVSKFKQQYKLLTENFTSESEVKQIENFMDTMVAEYMEESDKAMDDIRIRYHLIMNKEIIPLAYIARNYFKKSKNWLYQRLNGNVVNGKPANFSPSEIQTLHVALSDISNKIGSIA
ncbi:hypothetical protein FACS189437_02080 [Bacteroidia bacterium]|nr:hypothetical protein FACS189437_02080 [Bacteroidia bacterium]